jgi:hypothetical protein
MGLGLGHSRPGPCLSTLFVSLVRPRCGVARVRDGAFGFAVIGTHITRAV